MTAYNLTGLNITTSNWVDVIVNVNSSSDYWFASLILCSVFVLFLMAFRREDGVNEFIASSFITSMIAVLMLFIGLLPWSITIIPIVVLVLSVMLSFFR